MKANLGASPQKSVADKVSAEESVEIKKKEEDKAENAAGGEGDDANLEKESPADGSGEKSPSPDPIPPDPCPPNLTDDSVSSSSKVIETKGLFVVFKTQNF